MGSCVQKATNISYVDTTNPKRDQFKGKTEEDTKNDLKRTMSNVSSDSSGSSNSSEENLEVGPKENIFETNNVDTIEIFINGKSYKAPKNVTIFEACEHFLKEDDPDKIPPTLCFHPYLPSARLYQGKCGICEVENVSTGELLRSCKEKVKNGMSIKTFGKKVDDHVKKMLLEKLSEHPLNCPTCDDNGNCIFQHLLMKYDLSPKDLPPQLKEKYLKESQKVLEKQKVVRNEALFFDKSKCLSCYRCIRVCEYVQGMSCQTLLKTAERNIDGVHLFRDIEDYHESMYSTDCISCGQCAFVCPTGAISASPHIKDVSKLLDRRLSNQNGEKIIIAQIAPSVRVTISEEFGLQPGKFSVGQLVCALKKIGFDHVFDVQFGADLTVMEESAEFLDRIKNKGPFPMFSSCCPAWINLVEKHFPEFIPNLSTCKSPQQMMGSIIKTYWAKKQNIKKENIIVVSLMPCIAKKDEISRINLKGEVDYVLTTREIGRFLKSKSIALDKLKDEEFDSIIGESSSAGHIFGASGGVAEAVIRTVYKKVMGEDYPSLNFQEVRGLKKMKKAELDLKGEKIKIGVIHTSKKIRDILQKIKEKEMDESFNNSDPEIVFYEMMACPGGCIGGGGNPKFFNNKNTLEERKMVIYNNDENSKIRSSHENPLITKIYDEFLQQPLSEKSKELLHTKYTDRCESLDGEKKNKMLLI